MRWTVGFLRGFESSREMNAQVLSIIDSQMVGM